MTTPTFPPGSGRTPGAEVTISEDLVRGLIADQHPDLADLPLREVDGGWGNQMWRLGDDLAVRIQRMDTTPDHQLRERRWLPVLAPRLPLPVPVPVRDGVPSARFAKLWTVMTWVPGTPLDHGEITRGEHAADALAAFLQPRSGASRRTGAGHGRAAADRCAAGSARIGRRRVHPRTLLEGK